MEELIDCINNVDEHFILILPTKIPIPSKKARKRIIKKFKKATKVILE